MKLPVVFVCLALALLLPQARAQQAPDDQYVVIYSLIQQAEMLENSGNLRRALTNYVEAKNGLEKLQKTFPDWSPKIVDFRLSYLAEKIAQTTGKLPATRQSEAPSSVASVPAPSAKAAPVSSPSTELELQLNVLHEQVKQLQVGNETLRSKLKEALAAQPAAVDPREVAQIREQLRFLMKENDLLKVSLAQRRGGTGGDVTAKSCIANTRSIVADQRVCHRGIARGK